MNRTEYMREYRKTPEGYKSMTFVNWKGRGLIGDYNSIFERYINTSNCDLCNVLLEGRGSNRKCMDHCHKTGNFRNVVCHSCNSKKTDNKKPSTNKSGYKNILFHKKKKSWIYRKQYQGKDIIIMRKSKTDILCIKFAAMLLYRN